MKFNKKYITTLLLLIILNYAKGQNNYTNAGLFNRLIEIKYSTELYLTIHAKNASTKDSALAIYNLIRWQIDGFVMQVSADIIASNSPRKLIQLNKWCTNASQAITPDKIKNKSLQLYAMQFAHIDKLYRSYIFPNNQDARTLNLTTNVFYFIKDSWAVVKGIEDIKTQKTMALIELFNQTRLINPLEILKQK